LKELLEPAARMPYPEDACCVPESKGGAFEAITCSEVITAVGPLAGQDHTDVVGTESGGPAWYQSRASYTGTSLPFWA
jgi:hypothetical protein